MYFADIQFRSTLLGWFKAFNNKNENFLPILSNSATRYFGVVTNTRFYKEDRIGRIAFNFEMMCYKKILYLIYHSPTFSRYVASPNFITI